MIWAFENTRCFINDSNLIETGLWDKHLRGTTQWSSRPNMFFCHIDCKIGHTLDSKSLSVVEILRNMNATLNNLSPHKYIFVLAWKFAGNYKMKKNLILSSHLHLGNIEQTKYWYKMSTDMYFVNILKFHGIVLLALTCLLPWMFK